MKQRTNYRSIEALPEHLVGEIIDGELVTRQHGRPANAMVRSALLFCLGAITRRRSNPKGGWQIVMLPEVNLGSDVLVPELAGWRVERMPYLPDEAVHLAPDWVCELTSSHSTINPGLNRKLDVYADRNVRHAWLIDLGSRKLTAMVNEAGKFQPIATFDIEDAVRAAPFDAIAVSLADLWPLDRPLGFNEDPTPLYAGDR